MGVIEFFGGTSLSDEGRKDLQDLLVAEKK
jgi:hypothetical protein